MAIAIVIPNVMSSWRACVTTPGSSCHLLFAVPTVAGGLSIPLDCMPWAALHKRYFADFRTRADTEDGALPLEV